MITLNEKEFYTLIENACESVHLIIEVIKYIINAYIKAFNKKLTEKQIASLNTSLLCDLQVIFKNK